ncbi:MAG: DHA2 family efflux MFS transporter permease subunit [Devosia nanyangense]|uniref:DHA2 family efflux MFS transporter permease subunit n=1 Tax=Devosia nanyangense TaxID=1228055 RepID=A0A933L2M8_9HYPH|nr:DHA2 family efflux MFS transporter permease subunit [Devosia nanyangense]
MVSQFHPPQNKAEADPRRWVALIVLLIASFMNLIDVTIVNVALPSLQESLGADPSQIQWVIAAYVLAFALGLLPFGRLGDIVGRTKMFLIGVSLFTVASAACGLAPSIEWLIAARVLQGLAGAVMTPQVLAIATVTFPPEERGQSFSLFGLSAGLAAVAGPIIGGLLIGANLGGLDWRPIFLVNVPVGILAVVLGWFIIPRPPGHPDLKNDFVGIGLFAASMVALVYPLIEGRSYGWPAWSWGLMALSAVGLALFVLWERRMAALDQPQLLNFSLIGNGNFLLGAFVATIFSSGIPGFFMVISILLQGGFGFTPLESGLTNTPFSVGVLVISLISGRFGSNYLRLRLAISAVLLTGGMIWLEFVIRGIGDSIDHWTFLPPLFIAGLGLGLGFSALFQSVLSGVPPRDAGAGAGALQAFQQVGGAIGVALIGQLFFTSLEHARDWGATSMHMAFTGSAALAVFYQIAAFGLVLLLAGFLKARGPAQGQGSAPAPAGPPPVAVEA